FGLKPSDKVQKRDPAREYFNRANDRRGPRVGEGLGVAKIAFVVGLVWIADWLRLNNLRRCPSLRALDRH
ncbi:MAG: hypothetical protein ACI9KS_001526, partial [Sulfitobacter sp.]